MDIVSLLYIYGLTQTQIRSRRGGNLPIPDSFPKARFSAISRGSAWFGEDFDNWLYRITFLKVLNVVEKIQGAGIA